MIQKICKDCGRSVTVYNTITKRCQKCEQNRLKSKPKKKGKEASRYSVWRDVVARPYLDKRYGRECSICKMPPPVNEETGEIGYHDVDHKKKRGSNPQLKYSVQNIRYLCRNCHIKETDKKPNKSVDTMITI